MNEVIVVGFVILVSVLTDLAIYAISKVLPKRNPNDLKYQRWESGNISVGYPKYTLPMQYFGFMVLFMAFEPIIVLLLLLSVFPSLNFIKFLVIAFLSLIPALYFSYDVAYKSADRRDVYG